MNKHNQWLVSIIFVALLMVVLVGQAQAAPLAANKWEMPRISIVWPHDGGGKPTSVLDSKAVNVSVWPSNAVSCTLMPDQEIVLWRAKNNEPAEPVSIKPQFFNRTHNNVPFPSLEFNTVPADIGGDPLNRFYFLLGYQGNVWVDAADARTYLPYPVVPAGFSAEKKPAKIDARIQIVYPHDRQGNFVPVEKATLVNVAVDLFEHGTLNSVPGDYDGSILVLYIAEANSPMTLAQADAGSSAIVATANLESYMVGDVKYPRWVFNNVKVEAGKQYHYLVKLHGVETYPSLWTHASDARTYLPNPAPPPACK